LGQDKAILHGRANQQLEVLTPLAHAIAIIRGYFGARRAPATESSHFDPTSSMANAAVMTASCL
jgi:hypothetical protein